LPKFKFPEGFLKFKKLKSDQRWRLFNEITEPLREIFGDQELPIVEATCTIDQGITESARLMDPEPERSLNGTFTIMITVNGGAQHITEENTVVKIRRSILGRPRIKSNTA